MANLTNAINVYRSLDKANNKVDFYTKELQIEVQKFCDFEIFITTMAGDGVCVMTDALHSFPVGMPILDALAVIKKYGVLTEENWFPTQ